MRSQIVFVVCCLLWLTACSSSKTVKPSSTSLPVQAQSLPSEFGKAFLRIETGMHTAVIKRIAVDAKERYLVTASEDKTARLWDLKTGTLLQVLRPPIGEGNEGKLFAVAISPDGAEVAVGGFTAPTNSYNWKIYFFDRVSGRLTRQISGFPEVILHLSYSSNGEYLAISLAGKNGIRVYETNNLQQVASDNDYGDSSYWVEFDRAGHLLSSSYDSFVRLYDKNFRLLKKQSLAGGKKPYAARFSPDGTKIAVGFHDSTAMNVLSSNNLELLYSPDTQNINNGSLLGIAWSADGQSLYAGGSYAERKNGSLVVPIFKWSKSGQRASTKLPATQNTIIDIRALSQNRVVYGATDPAWAVLNDRGMKQLQLPPALIDHRNKGIDSLRLNADATVVEFIINNKQVKRFAISDPSLSTAAMDLTAPKTFAANLDIKDWHNEYSPKLNGKALNLRQYEMSHRLAISADTQHFLLGTDWYLRFYDAQSQQQWQTTTPATAWAVNISRDQRFAVAAFADGTIRWYRLTDGKEQIAYFPHANGKDWVVWTPEGFFNANEGGKNLIGYHLNQGADKEGLFVGVKQLYDKFYRPDLIAKRLQGDETAIQHALNEIGDVQTILKKPPPRLELISKEKRGLNLVLKYRVIDQGGGIGKLSYRINGVEQQDRSASGGIPNMGTQEISIPLSQTRNTVEVLAGNKDNTVESQPLKVEETLSEAELNKPSLYVLAIGVSDYTDRSMNLNYAHKDADAVSKVLDSGGEKLFHINPEQIITLTNKDVTLENIQQHFAQLAGKIKPEDVFILYMAGHGRAFDGRYHFIPSDAIYSSEKAFRDASLDESKLREMLASIKAQKSVLILDTCYAGKMTLAEAGDIKLKNLFQRSRSGDGIDEKAAISRLMRTTGRAILAASTSTQLAQEGYKEHGYFTYALLEGLKGKADADDDSFVNITELHSFLSKRVPELTQQRQFPVMETESLQDFPLSASERENGVQ